MVRPGSAGKPPTPTMRPDPKKRVQTSGAQAPLTGVGDALAGLALSEKVLEGSVSLPVTEAPEANWKMGRVVLRRERAHRGGKTVIVIDDFATHLPVSVIEGVARKVRAACGCGGTVKGRQVEIQGDQPAKVRAALEAEGFQVAGVK